MPTRVADHKGSDSALRQSEALGAGGSRKSFETSLAENGLHPLRATGLEVLQVNVGKACNQSCRHCHVEAGPNRAEAMTRQTIEWCLEALATSDIRVLDITGGAPELNPNFRWLVAEARRIGREVIDRSNLTVLTLPGFEDLPKFLAEHRVTITASLPCYLTENVDAQRGEGTFDRSIRALRRLNALGYGRPDSGLVLNLVYNPLGPALPPCQETLEAIYRQELLARHGVVFNRLLTLTNAPIGRFRRQLVRTRAYETYMDTLATAFNPGAAAGVMCRTMLSVDWRGRLYDCDFNQMLALGLEEGRPQHIRDFDLDQLAARRIVTGEHCYACTAGAGSGCQGAILQTAAP